MGLLPVGTIYPGVLPIGSPANPTESQITLSDVSTGNAGAGAHGFMPKLSGAYADLYRGDGTQRRLTGWEAQDHNLLAWTADPVLYCSGSYTLSTPGRLYVVRILIPAAMSITNVLMYRNTAGATLTASQNFVGVYQGTTLIGASADQTTAWVGSAGLDTYALVGGPFSVAAGSILVAFYYNGTTGPTFRGQGTNAATLFNIGLSASNYRMGYANTGLTTALPATGALATLVSSGGYPMWAAVS